MGLFGICSEVQSEADQALRDWKLEYFESMLGDNENCVVGFLKQHYLKDLCIMNCPDRKNSPLCLAKYPEGAVQPAVLVFIDAQPILAWVNQPSVANLNGSLGRPDVEGVWKYIPDALKIRSANKNLPLECSDGRKLKQGSGCRELMQAQCCVIQ